MDGHDVQDDFRLLMDSLLEGTECASDVSLVIFPNCIPDRRSSCKSCSSMFVSPVVSSIQGKKIKIDWRWLSHFIYEQVFILVDASFGRDCSEQQL